jgi:diacylglycerol kinase family enzyme
MRVTAVLNRDSGTLRTLAEADVRRRIAEPFEAAGHRIEIGFHGGEEIGERLRAAAAARPDALVVGGGDGTVRSAAEIVAGTGVAIGVLPLGTMNLFARTLGLPIDLDAAAAALAVGTVVDADLAEVDGRPFTHQISLGLQPRMVRLRERRGGYGSRLGKMLASALALRSVLKRPPGLDLVLEEDGRVRALTTPGLIVSNNPYGSGHLPYADEPATGLLGVYDVTSSRWTDLIHLVAGILWGSWQDDPHVEIRTARKVVIRSAGGPASIAATVDGELVRLSLPATVVKRPDAFRVIVARNTAAARAGGGSAQAAMTSPVVDSRPSMRLRFWTAAPDAPLPRLSYWATSSAWRRLSLPKTWMRMRLVPLSTRGSRVGRRSTAS